MSDKRLRDGWVSYLRSRVPDLLAAAAIALTMLLLMLSTQGRRTESHAWTTVPASPASEQGNTRSTTIHARLKPRPPRQPHFHQPATVILDATGAPALNPNNGHAGPFTVTVLSRVAEPAVGAAAPVPPASPIASTRVPAGADTSVLFTADATPAPRAARAAGRVAGVEDTLGEPRQAAQRMGPRAARVAQRDHGAREAARRQALIILVVAPPPGPPPDAAPKVGQRDSVARIAEVPHTAKYRDPKPSELIMRGLRGPA